MKIVHIVENLDDRYGGPARSVPLLCDALQKIDVNAWLLSIRKHKTENNETIKAKSLRWTILESSLALMGHMLILNRTEMILHINNLWSPSTLAAFIAAKIFNIPYVVSIRGMLYPWSMERSKYKKQLFWRLFQKKMLDDASCLHATEIGEADAIRALGVKAPIVVIPNGVELAEFDAALSKSEAQHSLGLDGDKRYALFLSRLHPKKGIEMLLEAWQKLDGADGWELLIVGGGDDEYEKGLRQQFAQVQNIRFLGRLQGQDRIAVFCSSDFFVLPSYSENFGMAIAEAMAARLAVITTKETPWSQIEPLGGKWIDANEESLAKALGEYTQMDSAALAQIGDRLRGMVEGYGLGPSASRMKAVYEWVLGKIEKPDFVSIKNIEKVTEA